MTRVVSDLAIGGFGDLWLYSGREFKQAEWKRDLRADVVADHACPTCRAPAGEPCIRRSVAGLVTRQLPHAGRAMPQRVTAVGRERP